MRYLFLMIFLCLSAVLVQAEGFEGKVRLLKGGYVDSDSIVVNENSIELLSPLEPKMITVEKSKIKSIEKIVGNYFEMGLGIGAIASPIMYELSVGYDEFEIGSFMALNVVGIGLGSLLGMLTKKYETVYAHESSNLSMMSGVKIMPVTYQPNINLIRYSYNF